MKSLFFVFCCLISFLSNGQTAPPDKGGGLSPSDFKHAKKLYVAMMNSDDFMRAEKFLDDFMEMAPIRTPMDYSVVAKGKGRGDAEKNVRDWITRHFSETKFKSVEEGVALYMKIIDLQVKCHRENAECYALIAKASKEQAREIFAPQVTGILKKNNVRP